ncbi:YwqH-like family protein [Bacillus swezeyi]|uniref:YwqH-like family protein n=1 Tax=Bacillus swezeyi TaxID=1925020 RepID=UPI003F8A5D2E
MIGSILGETLALDIMKVDLSLKKEFLAELKACRTALKNDKTEFSDSKKMITEPELTSHTWQGSLAESFERIRKNMKASFHDIEGKQISDVLEKIDERIKALNGEIHSLGQEIRSLERKIEREKKEARNKE